MLSQEILEKLSYACGCPLDVKEDLGIVNGVCPKHPKNKLLFDGVDLELYRRMLKGKERRKVTDIV